MAKAIAIVSGGMDSVTLAYLLAKADYALHLISFDYGQRHKKELEFARLCATRLNAQHEVIDISNINSFLKGSALTDSSIDVPIGHYADPTMALTVVPNRNAIMLAIAFGAAVSEGAEIVALAIHAGDHPIYPDCRPQFVDAFGAMEKIATDGYANPNLKLYAPFANLTKSDIVKIGFSLAVPYQETWSCYAGGEKHCGRCGTCVERREAFQLAGIPDPTEYE